MASYSLSFKPSVEKDLQSIPRSIVSRILDRIDRLPAHPNPPQLLAKRPIHLPPVADIMHRNLFGLAIDFIDDPIIAHTQTIQSFSTLQLR